MTKITSLTCLCADIFDGTGEIRPGGEALNFAAAACRYPHVSMSVIGAVGDDECGKAVVSSISAKPIDSSCIHIVLGGTTASNRTYLTEDGDRYYKHDSWNGGVFQEFSLSADDIEKLADSDIVHTNFYCPIFGQIAALKEKCGFKLSVDFDIERDPDKLENAARFTDFFFISGDDLLLPKLKEWSKSYDGIFIATLAERGSAAYKDGAEYRVNAVPVQEVIDTTGCGDSYQAGFVARFSEEGDITAAMNEGSRAASETLSHIGGFLY